MSKFLQTIAVFLFVVFALAGNFLPAQAQMCVASFDILLPDPDEPLLAKFINTSQVINPADKIIQSMWSFGDGTANNSFNTAHNYANPGTYLVCLTTTTNLGGTCTFCDSLVLVGEPLSCEAKFTYTDTDLTVSFTNNSIVNEGELLLTLWDFDDGTTSILPNPTHTFKNEGSFNVCLTITTTKGCKQQSCYNITVINSANCEAKFNAVADSLTPLVFYFDDASSGTADTWSWSFGDGTVGTGANVQHVYTMAGTYYVCLTIANSMGCSSYTCQTITVIDNENICLAKYTYNASGDLTVKFTDASKTDGIDDIITNWTWTFGDGTASNEQNPEHVFTANGFYDVCLTITTKSGCTNTICNTINLSNTGSLCGIITAADLIFDFDATVYLIYHDPIEETLIAIDSTFIDNDSLNMGKFCFENITPGFYLIKAGLNPASKDYDNYLPTYYASVANWSEATPIEVKKGETQNITFNLIPGENPGGPAFIGGYIADGAGKQTGGNPSSNISVILLNENQTPIAQTLTNAIGNYQFENLPYGNYYITTDVLNKTSDKQAISLSADTPNPQNIDFEVNNNHVNATNTTAIDELLIETWIDCFYGNPNPVINLLSVYVCANETFSATIQFFSADSGTAIYNLNVNIVPGLNIFNINAGWLPAGAYICKLSPSGYGFVFVKL